MAILDTSIAIYNYFEQIAKIPHGSYNEGKIADFIVQVAKKNNLKYIKDDINNVIVFKDASQGYEKHPPLMLQGHMDMVNEKNNDSDHDFDNDPLDLYVEDGFLHAKGTTLGADDGCGVCYMLAILTDKNLKHPALECVFTVQEEVGLCGAFGLDTTVLLSKRMIGLDSETQGQTCTSSSGGRDVMITKPFHFEDNEQPIYTLEIKGLLGGHSGECIDLARGNANKLTARVLYYLLKEGIDVHLIEINGGLKNNAIPRECTCSFSSSTSYEEITHAVMKIYNDIKYELENSDPNIEISLYQNEEDCDICICRDDSEAIITMIYLMPNGMIEKSQMIKNLTTISLNMGIIRTYEDRLTIDYSLRTPIESIRNELTMQLDTIASLFNAYSESSNDYPGWDYDAHSQLRQQFKEFYKSKTGNDLKEIATHGGLETGILKGKILELDIITMGPNMSDIHTPDEKLDLKSYLETYQLLVEFIETL